MHRVTHAVLVVPLLLPLCCVGLAQTEPCPADGICDLSTVKPVCGIDGITYQSSCLAACQDIAVAKLESCKPADARQFSTPPDSGNAVGPDNAQGSVNTFHMNRFKDEGFHFVGLGRSDPNFRSRAVGVKEGTSDFIPKKLSSAAVRFVFSTGYLYRSTDSGPVVPSSSFRRSGTAAPAYTESYAPIELKRNFSGTAPRVRRCGSNNQGSEVPPDDVVSVGRKLLNVFAPDGRVRQTATDEYPWSAVGLLQAGNKRCSAAMISPSAAITAAHCIHGGQDGVFASSVTFTPGARIRGSPFNVVAATLYDEWARSGCNSNLCTVRRWTYNLAVVVFEKPIGTELGFFGLAASDSFSIYATIAGFPEDKPSGEMWRQRCRVTDRSPNNLMTRTTSCDIATGQEGSAVWETRPNDGGFSISVRAIVSASAQDANYLSTITTARFWNLMTWSGEAFTQWDDAGSADAYRSIYLDRHDITCADYPGRGLSQFRLEADFRMDGCPNNMRIRYQCSPLENLAVDGGKVPLSTPDDEFGNGNTGFLDRHDVTCPENSVLIRWRLTRPTPNELAVSYWCASANIDTCEDGATDWVDNENGELYRLEQHPVACRNNMLLSRWKLEYRSFSNEHRIVYRCCGKSQSNF